ncbi:hypothetical protein IFM89_036029 [Coptis chinensis]|uniref:Uncharacterized protein n=1 Tax=Coptis chinensis TaxID=261450 RepID=A0A835H961_9MAGN|nr:hypothetical protein IFM89_036029 [Coptis chinensis]
MKEIGPSVIKKNTIPAVKKKAPSPNSLHMSFCLEPTKSDFVVPASTRRSFIVEKMGNEDIVKRAFRAFQNNFSLSKPSIEEKSSASPQGLGVCIIMLESQRLLRKLEIFGFRRSFMDAVRVVDGPIVGKEVAAVRKVALKNVTVRPKPEKVIEISPDTEEEKSEIRRQSIEAPSKKKRVHTLTSVLTARSKVACGITNKPKDAIIDIDAVDADNHLAAVDYVEDIYNYYKLAENSSRSSRLHVYSA